MKQFYRITIVVLSVLAFAGWSGEASAERIEKVVKIEVAGNQRVDSESVIANLETREGFYLSAERVRRDIELLYNMGVFRSVTVESEHLQNGVKLIYRVQEKPAVGRITLKGNKKLGDEKIREKIEVKTFQVADPKKIVASAAAIKELYAEKGYHLAEVDYSFEPIEGASDVELVFNISENKEVRVKRINFIGNKFFSDERLKKEIRSKEKGYWSWLTSSGKYHEDMTRADVALLIYHYQNNGFLKVRVDEPEVYLSRDKEWLFLTYHITEGERYTIKSVDISGDIVTTKDELLSKFKTEPGNLYSRKNMEEDLQLLSSMYGDLGYFFVNADPMIHPDDTTLTAEIVYRIVKGNRVRIEKINVFGNTITRDKVIRRELDVAEGTYYNDSKIRRSKEKLMQLGYFEEVNFATPRGSEDDTINLNITVKEKPTGQFQVGLGFSSVESFVFNASIAKDNFFGYGWRGQFSLEMSSLKQLFVLSFSDSYFLDTEWMLGTSAYKTSYRYADFDRNSYGGSMSLGHRIFDYSSMNLLYEIEKVNISDISTSIPTVFTENLDGLTSSITGSMTRDTRNNRLFPSKGTFHQVSTGFAGVGGDTEYVRVTANARYYYPFWKTVFKFNAIAGYTEEFGADPVPLYSRYFMGGPYSLRGYFFRTIGPKIRVPSTPDGGDADFVYGGNKELMFNLEWELPIYDPIGFKAVTFVDGGDAYSEDENISLKSLRWDYGFGIRWNSPMGPLRFEWGIPIKKQPGEDRLIFNFTIGSFF